MTTGGFAAAATREILDPGSLRIRGTIPGSTVLLDGRVRNFGHVPELTLIVPGDLVLCEPVRPNPLSRLIQSSQRALGFDQMHARWTHAAIAISAGQIVEANLTGVTQSDLGQRAMTYRLCIRRPRHLNEIQRYQLAIEASTKLRMRYGFLRALQIGARSMIWGLVQSPTLLDRGQGVICSKLYSDSYVNVSGNRTLTNNIYRVTPADLSHSVELEDIAVGWLQIV